MVDTWGHAVSSGMVWELGFTCLWSAPLGLDQSGGSF